MQNTSDIEKLIETMTQLGKLVKQEFTSEQEGCTLLQILAIKYIYTHKEVTVGDLANHLQLSKSSATQLSERLVMVGLIKRINDTVDRRIVCLTLTEEGKTYIVGHKAKRIEKLKKLFSQVPASDIKELIRINTQLIETLKNEQKEESK